MVSKHMDIAATFAHHLAYVQTHVIVIVKRQDTLCETTILQTQYIFLSSSDTWIYLEQYLGHQCKGLI